MPASPPPAAAPTPESATTALYRAALGPVNTAHYLAVFERFDEAGRASPVWNMAAGLLTLNWMVFRQLWRAALVYLVCAAGVALLLLGLGHVWQWPAGVQWGVFVTLVLLAVVLPGAYGNAMLHTDIRRRMTRAVGSARTVREACATLEKQASSTRRLWLLVVANGLLALGAVAAVVALEPGMPAVVEASASPALVPANVAAPTDAATEPAPGVQPVSLRPPEPDPVAEPAPVAVSPPVLPEAVEVPTFAAPAAQPPPAAAAAPILAPSPPPAPDKVPASRPRDADVPQAHGINVGLFADRRNAEKAHARLVEAGFPAILQNVESPRGERTRVRVGPFAGRAQADEAAARIRAMGLDAVVFVP